MAKLEFAEHQQLYTQHFHCVSCVSNTQMRKCKLHADTTPFYLSVGTFWYPGVSTPMDTEGQLAVYTELLKWLFLRDGYAEGYKVLLHDFVVLELVIYYVCNQKIFFWNFREIK